jgi:acyl-lipid omega-6 desaturase (Delta-12 desaturase)
MERLNTKQLRAAISEYTQQSTKLALVIFGADLFVYIASIAGVILLENFTLRLLCGVLAGFKIASLFIIGHDASHSAFTNSKILNGVIARIAFLPSLHNYGLWLVEHNRIHHQSTNVKELNSWTPYSKEEYDDLPVWRKRLERFYRSPAGISFYYMIERWWKNKFYPFKSSKGMYNSVYWDFILVATYLVSYLCLLTYAGQVLVYTSPVELIVLGFVVPFMIWNFMMGFTVYQQHTHETIPWVNVRNERDELAAQEDFTMHVQFPHWYNLVSFNIMEHTAHHVDPRIPLYHLAKAQAVIMELLGDDIVTIKFTFKGFLETLSKCKLYDYENHQWLDFDGKPTSIKLVSEEQMEFSNAA